MSGGEHAGLLLRSLRLQAGMSLEDVATEAETSVDFLRAVEEGTHTASLPFLRHVAGVIAARLAASAPAVRREPRQDGAVPEQHAAPA